MKISQYILSTLIGIVSSHFFIRDGIDDVQNYLIESKMQEMLMGK